MIYNKLIKIQEELKAPKNQYNKFSEFWYRSCEDILEAVKPICRKYNTTLLLVDKPIMVGDWHYIEATAILIDNEAKPDEEGSQVAITASAREPEAKTKMDLMQITGATSSYARKYALNGLFCIDDAKDADTDNYQKAKAETITETITPNIEQALITVIRNNNMTKKEVSEALQSLKHTELKELKIDEVNSFKKLLGVNN